MFVNCFYFLHLPKIYILHINKFKARDFYENFAFMHFNANHLRKLAEKHEGASS